MGKNAIGGSGLVAIDFEFCAYNYRAYDIANHWAEWIYDYGNKEYPYYFVNHNKAPTIDQKVNSYCGVRLSGSETPSRHSHRFMLCVCVSLLLSGRN